MHSSIQPLQFYASAPYPCNYLPEQTARSQVATPNHAVQDAAYAELIESGFRRSGLYTYRPRCDQCQACIPLRILVPSFIPTRSQRRAWSQHHNLQTRLLDLFFSQEHYELFKRYQNSRHANGGMNQDSADQYSEFLLQSHVNTRLVEFRNEHGQLKMISVVDVLERALSAVYTFYELDDRSSYGTYGVLWAIEYAKQLGIAHVYLGYWIANSPKMRYKANFEPNEKLVNGCWRADEKPTGIPTLDE